MPDPRATYATRFNARAIERPRPPAPPMTDEQFEAYVATLTPLGQSCARLGRTVAAAFPPPGSAPVSHRHPIGR